MLASSDGLEADERYLHGEEQSQDVEGRVACEQAAGVAAHHEQSEHVQRDQVYDEHVSSPCWHLTHSILIIFHMKVFDRNKVTFLDRIFYLKYFFSQIYHKT